MKLSLGLKIAISVILVFALGAVFFLVDMQSPEEVLTDEVVGQVRFKLYDRSDELVIDDDLDIYKDETLYSLLNRHYDLVCADAFYQADPTCSYKSIYGYALLEIEDVKTNWYGSNLSIFMNGSLATLGVSNIKLQADDVIEIRVNHLE